MTRWSPAAVALLVGSLGAGCATDSTPAAAPQASTTSKATLVRKPSAGKPIVTFAGLVNDGQPLAVDLASFDALPTQRLTIVEPFVKKSMASPDNLVGPDEFITVAEEVGLMGPIGRWVLREACRQRVDWASQGECSDDLAISVNLSPRQFNDATLVADVSGILAETGLPGNLLILGITETAIIGDIDASRTILSELRRMGVRVALDDFGTGYSSLSHLSELPIGAIKIDRRFVAEMCTRTQDALIVEAVITLAHSPGMSTIAEGVETQQQLEALRVRGCDSVQGLLSRPVPGSQVPALLAVAQMPTSRPLPRSRRSNRAS